MVGRDGQIALVLQALDDVQIGPAGDPCETPQPQIEISTRLYQYFLFTEGFSPTIF